MRYFQMLIILFCLFVFQRIAFADFVKVEDPNSSCQVKLLRPLEDGESLSWSGPCENSLANGEGVFVLYGKNGNELYKYSGFMKDGVREGHATIETPNYKYEGDVKGCVFDGFGKIEYLNKNSNVVSYEGEFKRGLYNGKGSIKYKDGNVYTGEFKNGLRDGYGTFRDSKGKIIYDGLWKENVFLGK
ncbi:MORN repeat-containing protein [Thermodesulfobium narugense DSM 14796]|uniref:MORN repeat-containing protein n=1 Tax=Thermodesulfobium narugense DSM 14796 TaxID=747365 RepID=M1E433_9BACT|nr:MORN repeat-containing protein [Thermodesulfobium narugense]AEE13692.1 MORN repeat-containing protein [Thermodesulfobium narugense DSM 14796]